MGIVILLGFSTTGKSYYCKIVKERLGDNVLTFDTDKFVSRNYDEHIYNLFLQHTKGNDDRSDALNLIDKGEVDAIDFLKSCKKNNILIAAGPFLVIRHNWQEYINSVPNIHFMYLYKTPDEVYDGLMSRRNKLIDQGLDQHSNFGCWDKDVLTFFNKKTYELYTKEEALKKIETAMNGVTPFYEKFSKENLYKSQELFRDEIQREIFLNNIISYLEKE